MHFFFQGIQGIGKSYMLQEALKPYQSRLAGFFVVRLYREGKLAGFAVRNVRQGFLPLDGTEEQGLEQVFLYQGKRRPQVLEQMIMQVERDSRRRDCDMVLLDEIGGLELSMDSFMEPLYRILRGGKPCVGVLKSQANLEHMVKRQQLDSAVWEQHRVLEQELINSGRLLTVTAETRDVCRAALENYIREWDADGRVGIGTGL